MKFATQIISEYQGVVVIVYTKKIISSIKLLITELISDKKANEIAKENKIFKKHWLKSGCRLSYREFNLLSLHIISNFRIINKGLVDENSIRIIPLIE